MSKYFILDTNVYLHYKLFTQINWSELLDDADPVLVVPITVINELDNKKYTRTDEKVRTRAKQVSDLFGKIMEDPQSVPFESNFRVRFLDKGPSIDWAELSLDRENADDRLLAEVIQFSNESSENELVLFSGDNVVKLKARVRGIPFRSLDDQFLMPFDDPRDKKLRELEREVSRYKSAAPVLALTHLDEKPYAEAVIKRFAPYKPKELERHLKAHKREHYIDAGIASDSTGTLAERFFAYDPVDVKRYLRDWEQHEKEYADYLVALREHFIRKSLLVEVSLILKNAGTAPAQDIDVFVTIPEAVQAVLIPDLEGAPAEPKLPRGPQNLIMGSSLMEALELAKAYEQDRVWLYPGASTGRPGTYWRYRDGELRDKHDLLKHGLSRKLDKFYLAFPSYDSVENLTLQYRILVGNAPEPKTGSVGIRATLV